jgi:hypothetical protein
MQNKSFTASASQLNSRDTGTAASASHLVQTIMANSAAKLDLTRHGTRGSHKENRFFGVLAFGRPNTPKHGKLW